MYQKDIERIDYIIKGLANRDVSFDINYCNIRDKEFTNVKSKINEPRKFETFIGEIIQKFDPKGLQVVIYTGKNPKEYQKHYIKIIDVHIPLIDDKIPVVLSREEAQVEDNRNNNLDFNDFIQSKIENATNALSGTFIQQSKDFEIGQLKKEFENDMRFKALEHNYTIEKLENKIEILSKDLERERSENEENKDALSELSDYIEELKEQLGSKKDESQKALMATGAAALGALLKNPEIAGLGALLMGAGSEDKTERAEAQIPEETHRTRNQKQINTWMSSLDDDTFSIFTLLVHHIIENPPYLKDFYENEGNIAPQ